MSRKRGLTLGLAIVGLLALLAIALSRIKPVAGDPTGDPLWTETVKKGSMPLQVRMDGALVHKGKPARFVARLMIPNDKAGGLRVRQRAEIHLGGASIKGRVSSISPPSTNGGGTIDVALDDKLPQAVAENRYVEGTINVGKIDGVLYVTRPVHGRSNVTLSIFKVVNDGAEAVRVMVKFGRASDTTIEVLDGLQEGDRIIPSDMSAWQQFDRIRLE